MHEVFEHSSSDSIQFHCYQPTRTYRIGSVKSSGRWGLVKIRLVSRHKTTGLFVGARERGSSGSSLNVARTRTHTLAHFYLFFRPSFMRALPGFPLNSSFIAVL